MWQKTWIADADEDAVEGGLTKEELEKKVNELQVMERVGRKAA